MSNFEKYNVGVSLKESEELDEDKNGKIVDGDTCGCGYKKDIKESNVSKVLSILEGKFGPGPNSAGILIDCAKCGHTYNKSLYKYRCPKCKFDGKEKLKESEDLTEEVYQLRHNIELNPGDYVKINGPHDAYGKVISVDKEKYDKSKGHLHLIRGLGKGKPSGTVGQKIPSL